MNSKRYNRNSTSITISVFYENYQLKKYNFNPEYQRDDNVWNDSQKSFLIDTIFKNFPMPPIFLDQKIETSTGKTSYDVIDGKQRLTTIISFIEGKVSLPDTFGNDIYGYDVLNGKDFAQIKSISQNDSTAAEFIADFWSYKISIEYIERPDTKVVDNIFDRLNREGSVLNAAELRKAKYYDSLLYSTIVSFRDDKCFKSILSKLNKNRLQDLSFITEIALLLLKGKIIDGVEKSIDETFDELVDDFKEEDAIDLSDKMRKIEDLVQECRIDFDKYSINGVSHLYAVFYLAYYMYSNNITVNDEIIYALNEFYTDLRGERANEHTQSYHKSMQSASKYKSSRKKRVKALLEFLNFDVDETLL